MAHLRDITRSCQTCGGRASVQLYNDIAVEMGYYCAKDGKKACERLKAEEAERYKREAVGE